MRNLVVSNVCKQIEQTFTLAKKEPILNDRRGAVGPVSTTHHVSRPGVLKNNIAQKTGVETNGLPDERKSEGRSSPRRA